MSKKKLRSNACKVQLNGISVTENVYLNENLCSYYKHLRFKCKKLWQAHMTNSFWVQSGKVFIKLEKNGKRHLITHETDLYDIFPEENLDEIYNTVHPPRERIRKS